MVRYYHLEKNKIKIIRNGVELPEAVHSRVWWRVKLGPPQSVWDIQFLFLFNGPRLFP